MDSFSRVGFETYGIAGKKRGAARRRNEAGEGERRPQGSVFAAVATCTPRKGVGGFVSFSFDVRGSLRLGAARLGLVLAALRCARVEHLCAGDFLRRNVSEREMEKEGRRLQARTYAGCCAMGQGR